VRYYDKLKLDKLSIVEIEGQNKTAAIALPAYAEDEGLQIIRMDGLLRKNSGRFIRREGCC